MREDEGTRRRRRRRRLPRAARLPRSMFWATAGGAAAAATAATAAAGGGRRWRLGSKQNWMRAQAGAWRAGGQAGYVGGIRTQCGRAENSSKCKRIHTRMIMQNAECRTQQVVVDPNLQRWSSDQEQSTANYNQEALRNATPRHVTRRNLDTSAIPVHLRLLCSLRFTFVGPPLALLRGFRRYACPPDFNRSNQAT